MYIACGDLDLDWEADEINAFRTMWKQGFAVDDIARALKRDADEVAILVIDHARNDLIPLRKNGVYGNRRPTS